MFPLPPITGNPVVDTVIWSEELSRDSSKDAKTETTAETIQDTESTRDVSDTETGLGLAWVVLVLVGALIAAWRRARPETWRCKEYNPYRMTPEEFEKFKRLHAANKRSWDDSKR